MGDARPRTTLYKLLSGFRKQRSLYGTARMHTGSRQQRLGRIEGRCQAVVDILRETSGTHLKGRSSFGPSILIVCSQQRLIGGRRARLWRLYIGRWRSSAVSMHASRRGRKHPMGSWSNAAQHCRLRMLLPRASSTLPRPHLVSHAERNRDLTKSFSQHWFVTTRLGWSHHAVTPKRACNLCDCVSAR